MIGKLRRLRKDERGVEPTVMKILVGVILVGIGLGIGIPLYLNLGGAAESQLDYSLSVSPSEGTVSPGNSITSSLEVDTYTEYDKAVTLAAEGVPENVSVLFNEQHSYTAEPPYTVTLKVSVGSGAESGGPVTITIRGESEGTVKTTDYELTIS